MLKQHFFDPNFKYASKELLSFLTGNKFYKKNVCLDVPSGNGRNIYLLSRYFNKVIGVDLIQKYLDEINLNKIKYNSYNIITKKVDVVLENVIDYKEIDFVCISHFYNKTFFENLEKNINSGVIIYIETPTCRGGNYLELPTEDELSYFLESFNIIKIRKKTCNSEDLIVKSVSFTAILEKK